MKQTHCLNCKKPVYAPHPKQNDTAECACSHWVYLNGHWRWKEITDKERVDIHIGWLRGNANKLEGEYFPERREKSNNDFQEYEVLESIKTQPELPIEEASDEHGEPEELEPYVLEKNAFGEYEPVGQ